MNFFLNVQMYNFCKEKCLAKMTFSSTKVILTTAVQNCKHFHSIRMFQREVHVHGKHFFFHKL